MLELYHFWDSVCSTKVRMCLAEKGLDYERRYVDILKFEQTDPAYLALNPNAVVPTLVHDGRAVIESSVINEYLDQVFPEVPLRPEDPYARAQMRIWVKLEDDMVHPQIRVSTFNLSIRQVIAKRSDEVLDAMTRTHPNPTQAARYKKTARSPTDMAAVHEAAAKLRGGLERMEKTLARNPWLAGEAFSLADIAHAPMMDRLEFLGLGEVWDGLDFVADWFARLKSRPSFAAAMPPAEHRLPAPKIEA